MELTEQELLRRQKMNDLLTLGVNPYPAEAFDVNTSAKDILTNYVADNPDSNRDEFKNISIAGRIMSIRDMGKAAFCVIQDSTGKIQLYIRRDDICKSDDKVLYDSVFKKLIDIGDIIGV
jgi:lysyl-tRNA synthetase class 2